MKITLRAISLEGFVRRCLFFYIGLNSTVQWSSQTTISLSNRRHFWQRLVPCLVHSFDDAQEAELRSSNRITSMPPDSGGHCFCIVDFFAGMRYNNISVTIRKDNALCRKYM